MDVKYINPLLESFARIQSQFGITDIKRNGIRKKSNFFVDQDMSAVICLKSGLQGHIALSMSKSATKELACRMTMGISLPVTDDMAKSALGELLTMIAGTALTMLAPLGVMLKVSPPIVLMGPSNINNIETLAIDYETPLGKIEYNIGFTE